MTIREVEYRNRDPRKERVADEMLEMGMSIAVRNITRNRPIRMIEGIVISSARKNSLGVAFLASGMRFKGEVPLIWSHGPYEAIGVVRSAKACGDAVRFTAEIMNHADVPRHLPGVEDLWAQLKGGAAPLASIGSRILRVSTEDSNVVTAWEAREISLTDTAADPGARVTSVYERAHVIYVDPKRPAIQYFWRES